MMYSPRLWPEEDTYDGWVQGMQDAPLPDNWMDYMDLDHDDPEAWIIPLDHTDDV